MVLVNLDAKDINKVFEIPSVVRYMFWLGKRAIVRQSEIDILKKYWGYTSFKSKQEEIINSVIDKKDTLALLPTAGGKSICFQIPALMSEGICIVVSPLISLMQDQTKFLKSKGVNTIAISSIMSSNEIYTALTNCIYGNVSF